MREVDDPGIRHRLRVGERVQFGRGVPAEDVRIAVRRGQQVVARRELDEHRRMHRHVRILPHADAQVVRLDRGERGARIGIARRVPREIERRSDIPRGAPAKSQHVARDLARAQLGGGFGRFLRRLVVRARHPQAKAPGGHRRRAPCQLRVEIQDSRRRVGAEHEEIERVVVDLDHVRAVRPIGVPDAMRDERRSIDADAPRALAGAGAPGERRVLVRGSGVDAERVDDLRVDELSALVERAELLAEAVHRLAGCKRNRSDPLAALAQPAECRKPRCAADVLVGDRRDDH